MWFARACLRSCAAGRTTNEGDMVKGEVNGLRCDHSQKSSNSPPRSGLVVQPGVEII